MRFRILPGTLGALLCVAPFVAPQLAAAPAPTHASSQTPIAKSTALHKAIAQTGLLDSRTPGISLWHDYGSFGLYRLNDAALNSLSTDVRRQLQIDGEMDAILFDRHPINTLTGNANLPARLTSPAATGSSLHLVQFVGPIKAEWLGAIEASGAKLVQYVANNAYIVWTDASARSQLTALAQDGDFVQYSGQFEAAYKLGPTIESRILAGNAPDEVVSVVVQMYNHAAKNGSEKAILDLSTGADSNWTPVLAFQNINLKVRAADLLKIAQMPDVVWVGERLPRQLMDEKQDQILAGHFNGTKSGPSSPGYLAWLDGLGFSQNPADYAIVSVVDDGVGNGTVTNGAGDVTLTRLGDGVTSRIAFVNKCTNDSVANGLDGHGHINTSIVGGYDARNGSPFKDPDGYLRGVGVSPYGRVANTKIFNNAGSFDQSNCGNSDTGVIKKEQELGALISSNSWGCGGCRGTYDDSSQAYDTGVRDANASVAGNQEMIYIFAAGNDGPSASTVGTPGNGKNMITVGASENQRQSDESGSWTDGCSVGPTGADNAMDVINFSSRGPVPGSRIKPEVIAPGTHIQGTASTATGYTGDSVCDKYRPNGQTVFAASSGTSHSTPAVSGVASLYYRWLQTKYGIAAASPALMKAYLIAHPTYLTGVSGNGNLPTNSQGYGMPNLETAFDTTPRAFVNQTQILGATGETWTWSGAVADPSKPVRIVMTYTDAPGNIGTSPQVNNLDLKAVVGSNTYLGNVFNGQWSTTGGSADSKNNYEAVFLPAGTSGALNITITAANIAGDGVPGNADTTDQDFAIVCYNCAQDPGFTLMATPTSQAICAPTNAAYSIDVGSIMGFVANTTLTATGNPGGTTANFSTNPVTPPGTSTLTIGNTGAAAAGSYTLTIGGTAVGGAPQSVDVGLTVFSAAPLAAGLTAPANGALNVAATPSFTWSAVAQAAGYSIEVATDAAFTNVVASASGLSSPAWTAGTALNTSTTYYWRVRAENTCGNGPWSSVFSFTTLAAPGDCGPGTTANVVYTYGFEAGASGWTTPAGVNTNTWTVSTANPKSGTSHYRGTNTAAISDQSLVSPSIALPSGQNPVVLKFQHVPNLENSGATACYDGGILEVSADGGVTWAQVPNANLLVGPYVGAISGSFSNPLAGKQAWCSAVTTTYRQTIADVSSYAGQTVQFRFRIGTDTSVGRTGWDVDDVMVQSCTTLSGDPNANVTPASLSANQPGNSTTTQTLTIANTAGGSLDWTIDEAATTCASRSDAAWLSAAPAGGSALAGGSNSVTVSFDSTGLSPGTYDAMLCIDSNDPDSGPGNGTALVEVPVQMVVTAAPPSIEVSPTSLARTQAPNTTTSQTLTVSNHGGGDLNWAIDEEPARPAAPAGTGTARSNLAGPFIAPRPNPIPLAVVVDEGFDDITALTGWTTSNQSNPAGLNTWFQGNDTVFPAYDGAATAYIAVNFNSTSGAGTISNWLVSPSISFNPGSSLSFYTRTATNAQYADRLEIRACTSGACTNTGSSESDVGDFTTLLLSINPTLQSGPDATGVNGYPDVWTPFNVSGLPTSGTGRIAFRYHVTNGGPAGSNSNYIGIDRVQIDNGSGVPATCSSPSDVPWLSTSPTSGTTAGGSSSNVTVSLDSTGLAAGAYNANLCVASNDPVTPLVVVPVLMTVTSGPITHQVTSSVGTGSGSINPAGAQTVNDGATATFTLTPNSGQVITGVGGTCGGTLTGNSFVTNPVTADCTVIANFDVIDIFKDGFEN